MSDFDNNDIIKKVAPVQAVQSDFAPTDVLSATPVPSATAAPSSDFDAQDIHKPSTSDFDQQDIIHAGPPEKPTGMDNMLNDADLSKIAAKYGVSSDELRNLAPYYDAQIEPHGVGEGLAIGVKSAAGLLGRTAGLGIPQFAYKKLQEPRMKAALDELRNIGSEQSSKLDVAKELVMPGGFGHIKNAAGRVAAAAAAGGLIGTTGSNEGQEDEGLIHGAKWGSVLGLGGELLGKILGKAKPNKVEAELAANADNKQYQFDLEKQTQEVAQKTQDSEKIIRDTGLSGNVNLDEATAARVVEQQLGKEALQDLQNSTSELAQVYRGSRMEEAASRGEISSKMGSLEAEQAYLQKQKSKGPTELLDVNELEKELIRVQNSIQNTKRTIGEVNRQSTAAADRGLVAQGDTPSLGKRAAGQMDTLEGKRTDLSGTLDNLREAADMLKMNIQEAGGQNRNLSSLNKRLKQIESEYTSTFGKIEKVPVTPSAKNLVQEAANDIVKTRTIDFAEDLLGHRPANYEEALQEVKQFTGRQGQDAISQRYNEFVNYKQAERAIQENALKANGQPGFVGKALNFLSDNQFVLRGLDNKYGTKLEPILQQLNKDFNRSTFAQRSFRQGVESLFNLAKKHGLDSELVNGNKIYNAIDNGTIAKLAPAEQEIANEFVKYFSSVRDFANRLVRTADARIAPMSIPNRRNYVPKILKPTQEMIPLIQQKMEAVLPEVSGLLKREVTDLAQISPQEFAMLKKSKASAALDELVNVATMIDTVPVASGADLSSRLKDVVFNRQGNIALETKARAAFQRSETIPEFLLETDLYKLARKHADNTLKHLYLRNSVDKLGYQAKMLSKAGADVEAKYVQNIVQDLMGVRKGTAAEATMQGRISMNSKIDGMIQKVGKDSVQGGMLTAVKAMPDVMENLARQIYPNLLGYWNIRAVIQNATQGITKTAPELGTKYGYATLLRAAVQTAGDMKRLAGKAEHLGNVPSEFIRDGERAIAEGIQRSAVYTIPNKALEGMGKAGMIIFSKMEQFNRALTVSIGETMARDLAKGNKFALESLKKFPNTIQAQIMRQPDAAGDVIAKYLNDATMYNYNRASMSEYGRTMGPLFSAFSKWPTATVGEVVQEMREKGLMKGTARNIEKFVAPFLLLQAADYLMGERQDDQDSLSPVQKKLMGSHGLSQSAPIGSLGGVLKGEIFSPPAVDAFVQTVVNPILEGDSAKAERGAGTSVMNFAPTAGLFRFLFDDVQTYITGERPDGADPLERTLEGVRKATH